MPEPVRGLSPGELRARLLGLAAEFVRDARTLAGTTRIATARTSFLHRQPASISGARATGATAVRGFASRATPIAAGRASSFTTICARSPCPRP